MQTAGPTEPVDPFDAYWFSLEALDERQRAGLPGWVQDILRFGEFMREITEDGLLLASISA